MPYLGGVAKYWDTLNHVANNGYEGMILGKSSSRPGTSTEMTDEELIAVGDFEER
jgi:hypothetical protein